MKKTTPTKQPPPQQPAGLLPLKNASFKKLGMIDTHISTEHPVFSDCDIHQENFTNNQNIPMEHGTAVASILCGQSDQYQGLLKNSTVYSASVFFTHPTYGETTSTLAIVQAIDWLITKKIKIINLSLAGPHNNLIQLTVEKAIEKGVTIIAAVGNNGPTADPVYPAAYDGVIGVTGISTKTFRVYRLAGRGAHVDISAPGVDIYHASAKGGFNNSTGTSFATPFISAALVTQPQYITALAEIAKDLGKSGKDTTYGEGLILSH